MIPALEVIVQKTSMDCAIAVLAMVMGRSYREVSDVARRVTKRPHARGLYMTDLRRIARLLHHRVVSVGAVPDDGAGMLVLVKPSTRHYVAVFQGVVIDPSDGLLWDLQTFLDQGAWTIAACLEVQ